MGYPRREPRHQPIERSGRERFCRDRAVAPLRPLTRHDDESCAHDPARRRRARARTGPLQR